ncbi:MAG: hypothetical protein L0Y44_13825 [Phycisphaerales bacterium]|nr:hypothetical protein [Phycisphaerales bacterium]MCI0631724.1 hypothetical protein [Phycisphaerales bacterium]MCI0674795.1 hypothetical protein [Phycisphaerales bacterium]
MPPTVMHQHSVPRLYDEEGDLLLEADRRADRVILLPSGDPRKASTDRDRIRIQWGQHLLADLLARRYRTLVCGVNTDDNSRGIIGELAGLLPTSQWNADSITQYARTFAKSLGKDDVIVLKYDMDLVTVLALLRPPGRDHFTLESLKRGIRIVAQMVETRYDRLAVASVSFLGAKSNRLIGRDEREPSFETVLRTMFESGYRGDVFPSLGMWEVAPTGVFASYPFPNSLKVMREGGF